MTTLNDSERMELGRILSSDASLGAFSGMIYNDMVARRDTDTGAWSDWLIMERVKLAIQIRLAIRNHFKQ